MANEYQNLLEDINTTALDMKKLTDKTKSLSGTIILEVEAEPTEPLV